MYANIISNDLLKIRPTFRIKYKVVPVYAMKAYKGSKDLVPLILNLGCRWR
jgi:hypothetical protein